MWEMRGDQYIRCYLYGCKDKFNEFICFHDGVERINK